MGALDLIRNRDARAAQNVVGTDDYHFRDEKHHQASDFEVHAWGPSTETRSSAGLRQDAREGVTEDAQPGVQKAEAVALVWSKKAAFGTYALVWLGFFILALQSSISSAIIQNVFANFSAAPQVSTANILSNVVAGVLKLPVAKILTLWGRTEGLLVFVAIYVLGIIILAACNGPDSYAAGYVLYWVGYDALYLILDIFIADTTGLRNRAFAFAFASTPFICTAFTGPLAAQSFLKTSGWRWSYGVFAIVAPVVFLPLAVVFKVHEKKAENEGIFRRRPSGRTTIESIVHYIHEFDIIGAFLLMAAFTLVLLPFSLTSYGAAQYNSATFIAMVVVGFLLFPTFAAWERFGARTHFIRWELLKDRTVLGACFLSALLFFSFYCWDLYLLNFCVVVFNLSIAMAGYVNQIFNVGSTFWSVLVGIVIRITRQFKYQTLFFGMPLLFLGSGLMIHFRGQNEDSTIGYVVMCQIFIAFGGSTLAIGQDMAVMAAADRESVPMMLSILSLSSSIGTAVGFAASASVFNNTFLKFLTEALPESSKDLAADIYIKGYVEQITYPVGSEIRNAINQAWSEYMKYACILSTCVLVLGFPAVAVWRNYRLDRKQNKGVVL